jgi:hypothetical protein
MSELRMLAEWSVDIGADSPWLVIPWEGWVDLRNPGVDSLSRSAENSKVPAPIAQLTEVVDYPEVASLLQLGNQPGTLTSKIDVFPIAADEVDPEIAEYGPAATAFGLASYLDVLSMIPEWPRTFEQFEQICRTVCSTVSATIRSAVAKPGLGPSSDMPVYVEIVLRRARLYDRDTYGWTLYAAGFGPHPEAARSIWSHAATALTSSLLATLAPSQTGHQPPHDAGE